jgi:hypothetical protein
LAWWVSTTPARAGDKALAEALFAEAQVLFERGETAAACQKFAASQAQEASSGTALNLARCYERLGKTASAWAQFEEAARIANVQGRQDRVDEARLRASQLKPKLSLLTIRVTTSLPEMRITRDGVELPPAAWGTPLPADPGLIEVVAEAPGHVKQRLEVKLGPDGDQQLLVVAPLQPQAVPQQSPSKTPRLTNGRVRPLAPPSRTPAYVVGGAGVAFLAAGTAFGLWSNSVYRDARKACGDKTTSCPPSAMELRGDAERWANVSNVGFGLGVVGLGVGTYLLLSASGSVSEPSVAPSAWVGREGAGAVVRGSF